MTTGLVEIVRNYAEERPIPCDINRWRSKLSGHGFPEVIPQELYERILRDNTITRKMVFDYQDGDATDLLVASMLWGFGPVPYGPYRTALMLTERDSHVAVTSIVDDIRTKARQSPHEGFGSLFSSRRSRIQQLGIAMGTKLLYFSAAGRSEPNMPLVLDQVVFAACQRVGISAPDPRRYTTSDGYLTYCQAMADQAANLGVAPDVLEMALFNWQQSN